MLDRGDSFTEWVSTGSIVQYRQSQLSISLPGTGITISNQPAWHIPYRWSTTSSCSPPYNLIIHSSTSQTTYTSCSGPRLNVKGDNMKAIPRGYKYISQQRRNNNLDYSMRGLWIDLVRRMRLRLGHDSRYTVRHSKTQRFVVSPLLLASQLEIRTKEGVPKNRGSSKGTLVHWSNATQDPDQTTTTA